MSEAEAASGEQPSPSQPADEFELNYEDLDAGDLEDMEAYAGQPVFGVLQQAIGDAAGSANPLAVLMATLPAKVFTALLGVAKRHKDPTFGPDRWRSIKLSEVAAPTPAPLEKPSPPTPIRQRSTGKGGAKRASGRRTSRPS
jgi:hypothetical protein